MRNLLVALVLFTLLPALPVAALSCVSFSPQEMTDRAEAVAVARVVQEAPQTNPPARPPVLLEVERVYKGELGAQVVVRHNPMIGPDIRLEQGKRYLLFLRRRDDGSRGTSLCDGTRELEGALPAEFAAVLGEGRPPAGPDDPVPSGTGAEHGAPAWVWWALPVLVLGGGVWVWVRKRR